MSSFRFEPAPLAASMPVAGRGVEAGLSKAQELTPSGARCCTSRRRGSERLWLNRAPRHNRALFEDDREGWRGTEWLPSSIATTVCRGQTVGP